MKSQRVTESFPLFRYMNFNEILNSSYTEIWLFCDVVDVRHSDTFFIGIRLPFPESVPAGGDADLFGGVSCALYRFDEINVKDVPR